MASKLRPPLLAALAVFTLFAALAWSVYRNEVAVGTADLQQTASRIQSRIDDQVSVLYSVRAFYGNSEQLMRDELRGFLESAEVNTRAPGMQGIGFAQAIRPGEEDRVRQLVSGWYGIDRGPWPESDQALRFPIVFLEPDSDRNRAALAYDMYSQPVRRAAMDNAIASGEPAATDRVVLVQEIDEDVQPGFLIYLPLFSNGEAAGGQIGAETREIAGFVYAPFRARDLFQSVLSESDLEYLDLTVHVETESPDTLLFSDAPPRWYTRQYKIKVADRDWILLMNKHHTLVSVLLDPALITLLFGLLLAALSGAFVRSRVMQWEAVHQLSEERQARADEKDLMFQEMKHRLKNAIARIQAIAHLSARGSDNIPDYLDVLSGRLQAMANAQDRLTASQWQKTTLDVLLREEVGQIADTESGKVSLDGPVLNLNAEQAQAVGLVVHELATNAAKYGAFYQDGELRVNWDVDSVGRILLRWVESGLATPPSLSSKGFGTELSVILIEGKLGGTFSRESSGNDLVVEISFPHDAD